MPPLRTMSLKAFHILFIVVSMVLGLALGSWYLSEFRQSRAAGDLMYAAAWLMSAGVLGVYGRGVLRKFRRFKTG
jgi:hypothetical protein